VEGGWLAAPLSVHARFLDGQGHVVSETSLTLAPR